MPARRDRQKRPQGHAPTIRTSINLTQSSWDIAEAYAAALGISRDAYIDELIQRDAKQKAPSGRPKWWTRRTAPKWWVDPDYQPQLPIPPEPQEMEGPLTQTA